MRQIMLSAALLSLFAGMPAAPAAAGEISSVYSDFEVDKACTKFSASDDGEGDWADFVCDGWRGYPVFLYYADLREALFYGFPPAGDLAPAWESFSAFNSSGTKIEWRLETNGEIVIPFATIHRWFVSDPEDAEKQTQVLVVEKVGQPHERDGCVVGYVVATGNSDANEKARRVADEKARDFACGSDEPVVEAGSVPLPPVTRYEN